MLPDISTNYELDGRFTLKQKLGEGGYGAVYEGMQTSVKRRCAIKLMRSEAGDDRQIMVERFKAEALATSKLQHPNTVVIYDFGIDETLDVLFLAMEFLGGQSLDDVLKREHFLPLDETLSVVNQVAASLHHAHLQGIIHRDIKPHNIMVLERDPTKIKVIDFGIARVLREHTTESPMQTLTRTGMLLGTPHFMAPEQIRGEEVDGRADIYALGMCVYRMLTGRTPFSGASAVDIACQHLVDTPKPLSAYTDELDLPEAFEEVLLKSVAKKPEDRFDTIIDFANALTKAARYNVQWSVTGALSVRSMDDPNAPAPKRLTGQEKLQLLADHTELPDKTVHATEAPGTISAEQPNTTTPDTSTPWVKPAIGIGVLIGLVIMGVALGKLASNTSTHKSTAKTMAIAQPTTQTKTETSVQQTTEPPVKALDIEPAQSVILDALVLATKRAARKPSPVVAVRPNQRPNNKPTKPKPDTKPDPTPTIVEVKPTSAPDPQPEPKPDPKPEKTTKASISEQYVPE